MHVTKEVKARVNAEINRCIAIANKQYGRTFAFPTIVYKKRGTTAGTACDGTYTIDLNPVLLMENQDAFMTRTVPHEFAHLVDGIVNPETRDRGWGQKRSVHGPSWKAIMGLFGCEASRCHTYDCSSVRIKRQTIRQHVWICGCGEGKMILSLAMHKTQSERANRYVRNHSVRKCGAYTYQGLEGQETQPVQKKAANGPKPKPKATGGSKLDQCRNLYSSTYTRRTNIARFVKEAGCTISGAGTYYAKIKKERGDVSTKGWT